MVADIVVLLFVAAITVRGYLRGLVSQIATICAALALWFWFDAWFPPVDVWLGGLHEVLARFEILRRIVAFTGAYLGVTLILAAIEKLLVERVSLLKAGNTWLGAALGLAKGVAYTAVAVWLIQVVVGGGEAVSDDQQPEWMSDSAVFGQFALWNPVRVYSAREMLAKSGAEEWGRRTYVQVAQEPIVRRMLEDRGIVVPPPAAGEGGVLNGAVPQDEADAPATGHSPASSELGQPPE
jgi:uncharacterized membrane protein required for colicin V production